mmetsp:Transcript_12718/g.18450  ORF Transcript_12718/g.18450 Transcript_12718/m.18450 type:complete len:112 (+) Transcript_12718:379-714(+)
MLLMMRQKERPSVNGHQIGLLESGTSKVRRETGRVPVLPREMCQAFSSTNWAGNDRKYFVLDIFRFPVVFRRLFFSPASRRQNALQLFFLKSLGYSSSVDPRDHQWQFKKV